MTADLLTDTTGQLGITNMSQTTALNDDDDSEPITPSPSKRAGDWGFGLADA
jgi:hypothetical protein